MRVEEAVGLAQQFLRRIVGNGVLHGMNHESCPEGTFIGQYESRVQLYNVAIRPCYDSRGTPYIGVHAQTVDDCEVISGDWRIYGEASDWDLPRQAIHS